MSVKVKGKLNFNKIQRKLTGLTNVLLKELGQLSYLHFTSAFSSSPNAKGGGKTNASRGGWAKRKGNPTNGPLLKTGELLSSIKVRRRKNSVIIYTNLPYAAYNNNGATGTGRGRTGTLPKREFIGESTQLEINSRKLIRKILKNIFN